MLFFMPKYFPHWFSSLTSPRAAMLSCKASMKLFLHIHCARWTHLILGKNHLGFFLMVHSFHFRICSSNRLHLSWGAMVPTLSAQWSAAMLSNVVLSPTKTVNFKNSMLTVNAILDNENSANSAWQPNSLICFLAARVCLPWRCTSIFELDIVADLHSPHLTRFGLGRVFAPLWLLWCALAPHFIAHFDRPLQNLMMSFYY